MGEKEQCCGLCWHWQPSRPAQWTEKKERLGRCIKIGLNGYGFWDGGACRDFEGIKQKGGMDADLPKFKDIIGLYADEQKGGE